MKFTKILLIAFCAIVLLGVGLVRAATLPAPAQTDIVNQNLAAENKLVIPPLIEPRTENGEKVCDLTAQEGQTMFFPGESTTT